MTETSPPGDCIRSRLWARATDGTTVTASAASNKNTIEARPRLMTVESASSDGKPHAISALFERARFIAPGEMSEHAPDQEQRAGNADDPVASRRRGALERLGGRAGNGDVDASRDQRPEGVGRRGARARRRDQDESVRERYQRGDDPGGVLVAENPQDERHRRVPEDVAEGRGQRARAGRIVRAVQHQIAARAAQDLKAARPPGTREAVANRGLCGAELARRGG